MDEEKPTPVNILGGPLLTLLYDYGFRGLDASPNTSFFEYGGLYSEKKQTAFLCEPKEPHRCTIARITVAELRSLLQSLGLDYYRFIGIPKSKALTRIDPMFHILALKGYSGGHFAGMKNWHPFGQFTQEQWIDGLTKVFAPQIVNAKPKSQL